jgi:hypothetical protein
MELFLITFGLLFLAVAGISIKIWGKKNGEFADNQPCGLCGKMPEETECKNTTTFNN